ncbi:hypothetical protein [Nocardia sp. NPDC057440]|uniref:hypothetical protein n=1 Tax=Nocardia sp. NPDC057440 TaxID=3346134 RepID=UPI00366EDADF
MTAADEVVLMESQLHEDATLARFDPIKVLTTKLWTEQVVPVDQLYKELVEDSNRAASQRDTSDSALKATTELSGSCTAQTVCWWRNSRRPATAPTTPALS